MKVLRIAVGVGALIYVAIIATMGHHLYIDVQQHHQLTWIQVRNVAAACFLPIIGAGLVWSVWPFGQQTTTKSSSDALISD